MSVIDQSFIPAYREAAIKGKRALNASRDQGWMIGVVSCVDEDGRPTEFLPTTGDTIWLDAEQLLQVKGYEALDGPPQDKLPATGDILRFSRKNLRDDNGRKKLNDVRNEATFVARGSGSYDDLDSRCHVVIITDGGTRQRLKKWHWASKQIDTHEPKLKVSDDAWVRFLAQVEGTDDNRKKKGREKLGDSERAAKERENKTVEGLGKKLGLRLLQDSTFKPGDALWIQVRNGEVVELSYSAIWRRVAEKQGSKEEPGRNTTPEFLSLKDLLGDELAPCNPNSASPRSGGLENNSAAGSTAGKICMSCSIFGIVGPEGAAGKEGQGYAGHIRVGSLNLVEDQQDGVMVRSEPEFMPLASPRPSNAQFYLTNPRNLQDKPTPEQREEAETTAHWDRREFKKFETKLAGRKFYWNHDPLREPAGHVYYRAFSGASPELVSSRKIVLAESDGVPTRLVGEIAFDQITAAELLSLWFLFDHVALFKALKVDAADTTVVRLGGGKPLGFGAAKPRIVGFNVSTIQNRYKGTTPDFSGGANAKFPLDLDKDALKEWVDELKARVMEGATAKALKDNIKALKHVMSLDGLGKDKNSVAYPPNAPWSQYGRKAFHESYEFFSKTNGRAYSKGWGDWKPLPVLKPDSTNQVID